jgi:protein TonB
MAPIAKENEFLNAAPETAVRPSVAASIPADNAIKQQPVALEVEVTVNGARTVEGSDKREPFSETTKTVLVFGSGAVIRLASSVTPGQLLFLTNEKTKKEVVCQVVKSKNYRNVSGYVELEFTESVVGFWGMRFPSDRIGSAAQPAGSTVPAVGPTLASVAPPMQRPAAPAIEPPAAYLATRITEQKPAAPAVAIRNSEPQLCASKFVTPSTPVIAVPVVPAPESHIAPVPATPASLMPELAVDAPPVRPVAPVSSTFDLPRTPEARASVFAPPRQAPTAPPAVEVLSLAPVPEANVPAPSALIPPQKQNVNGPETDALKQQTARLQEQLSSMLFTESPSRKPVPEVPLPPPVANMKPAEAVAKILEFAKTEPAPPPVLSVEPPKLAPQPRLSSLNDEELKIPSWLEPLARNAAAPTSTQELIEREKTKRLAELSSVEESVAESSNIGEEELDSDLHIPNFGSELRTSAGENTGESSSRKSGKGLLFAAIAAGVLIAAGGVWYFRQQSGGVQAGAASVSQQAPAFSVPAGTSRPQNTAALSTNPPVQTAPATQNNSPLQTNSNLNPSSGQPAGASLSPVNNKQVIPNPAKGGALSEISSPAQPAAEQPKKSALGEVRLAAPKVAARGKAQDSGEAEAGLAMTGEPTDSNDRALSGGLASNAMQPAAPAPALPIGGDVRQAKLIAAVPPVYPSLAKNQHVSGDVRIDALIDATGRVTTMKVVSGPTLLHQAAMDALRQWRYQAASLNGSAVSMHLTVTIQFRLQ